MNIKKKKQVTASEVLKPEGNGQEIKSTGRIFLKEMRTSEIQDEIAGLEKRKKSLYVQ